MWNQAVRRRCDDIAHVVLEARCRHSESRILLFYHKRTARITHYYIYLMARLLSHAVPSWVMLREDHEISQNGWEKRLKNRGKRRGSCVALRISTLPIS